MTEIILNGAPHDVAPRASLADLVEALSLSNRAVAVAINRELVHREQWGERELGPGDRVDVVHAIGGG